jgi:hypothetical protein
MGFSTGAGAGACAAGASVAAGSDGAAGLQAAMSKSDKTIMSGNSQNLFFIFHPP